MMTLSLEDEGAEVGVCRFFVDRCGFVSVDEDVHVRI